MKIEIEVPSKTQADEVILNLKHHFPAVRILRVEKLQEKDNGERFRDSTDRAMSRVASFERFRPKERGRS